MSNIAITWKKLDKVQLIESYSNNINFWVQELVILSFFGSVWSVLLIYRSHQLGVICAREGCV